MTSAVRPPTPDAQQDPDTPRSSNCLNCGVPLSGPFCAQCGQRDVPPYPSVRELAVDAFWELSGWDGRFATTVRALFRHPGMLTREFLEGRRARYISPLRLYLMASLVYFLAASAAPDLKPARKADPNFVGVQSGRFRIGAPTRDNAASRVGRAVSRSMDSTKRDPDPDLSLDSLSAEARREGALEDIAKAPAVFRPFLRKAILDPAGFKRSMVDAIPRLLFALLPIFAAILALFYHRRKYPEHLYFAVHLHAFVFLALAVTELVKLTRLTQVAAPVSIAMLLWIPVYTTIAIRRTYGGSIAGTVAKEVGIGVIYFFAGVAAFLVMLDVISVFN